MKRILRLLLLSLCAAAPMRAVEFTPIEVRQTDTSFNIASQRGVPISNTVNTPPGSDGRAPTSNESQGSVNPPTARQFSSVVSFGGLNTPTNAAARKASPILNAGVTAFSTTVAEQMQLPIGRLDSSSVIIARRTFVGAPYLSRQISFLFGSVISVPDTDENGLLLTNVVKETYWLAEPYTTNGHTNAAYYWSPNARKVYAIQPGPVQIVWKKATSTTAQPPDYGSSPTNYFVDGGNYFRLYRANYIVSGSAVKTPRKVYWTEKTFQSLSKLITIPPTRVGGVTIVYNNNFPKTVSTEYIAPGQTSPTDGSTNAVLQELRTLWFDQQQGNLHAYNKEGRVFVELLGDTRSDGQSRAQLGFEIVDVFKQVNPIDLTIELGERVTPPPPASLDTVFPEPVFQLNGQTFAFQDAIEGSSLNRYFATHETKNLNDFMVHWMEEGEVQIRWPAQFARYAFVWPNAVEKYSHYVRPNVATEAEARQTAVPLATENVPTIEYQDPLDAPRAKLTEEFKFYTWLTPQYPAHRTLLRFSAGENIAFERVFSWLDTNLLTTNFVGTVATNLLAWNSTYQTLTWPNQFQAPRVSFATVDVGQRIDPPSGELGSGGDSYMAGYIRQSVGTSFNPGTYVDPFVSGFEAANKGAIIPVNAIPNKNQLEVLWFRQNHAATTNGFVTINWPAVVGYYTIQWPQNPLEIILASNKGTAGNGGTDPLVSLGSIYYQNDSALPGYNPNEEHALMSGGEAFALRDDLNITNVVGYSSHPFVLINYTAADQRPAMAIYKVLREKPSAGIVFDYIVKAGTLLQPPMPLPLLPPPTVGSGPNAINLNVEPGGGDLPVNWAASGAASGALSYYDHFTYRDRKQQFWVYRGPHGGFPALQAGAYDTNARSFGPLPVATAVVGQPFRYSVHVSRQQEFLTILLNTNTTPAWLGVSGLALQGTPAVGDIGTNTFNVVVNDFYDDVKVTNSVTVRVVASGGVIAQAPLAITSSNQYTGAIIQFTNRPPFLAHSPQTTNSFRMQFYYKTMAGFAWPGLAAPPEGTIVPYLRAINPSNGTFVGDPKDQATASLSIVYRPVWPVLDPADESKLVPTLPFGQTLTKPVNGLPGVRDFKTAHILYQQSIAADMSAALPSVKLIDPTREKTSDLAAQLLSKLPAGIQKDFYQGKYYFPALPPHLSNRLFFDPARGAKGALVLQGEFKDEPTGDKYVLLNVLRGTDLNTAINICPSNDADVLKWAALVNALSTSVQVFKESTTVPGTYIPDTANANTVTVGVTNLAVIKDHNTAVDSYALSASGPGAGYVTLLEGSGDAFTLPGDPVAMHIIKVGGSLYTGELKVIPAPNPLSEQVTLQHTADFAGDAGDYAFEWKIGSPVDGLPPGVDSTMSAYLSLTNGADIIRYTIGGAGVRALSDNYVVMRYRPLNPAHPLYKATDITDADWSEWTRPALAEGWIKRVLAGINPFNQRTSDLFNNRVNTDVSIVSQAGHRWEGDVALNADTLNNYGLIEIYETVLRRGRSLSIESGFNYGPANDALLLAAGYLNDLYMMLGNEAWADAANPTIGIGTKDNTYGDIATALFAFKGQQASLLDEELALLRGRDDFLLPSVEVAPFYNRLVWNYTRGIDSGEVIYALNYNILDEDNNGVVDAADAAKLFPQAHGDAYGHFLTALSGYYSLLINQNFDWAPRIEAVNVLGQPVSVDYLDERKFAAAGAALARSAHQVVDLTWRKDYIPGRTDGWDYLGAEKSNSARQFVNSGNETNVSTRYWGLDHWATRGEIGAYVNWVVGNAILPGVDPNPNHEGIQKIDRTTVPELDELVTTAQALQASLENAEGGLTPLGLAEGSLAFDINPNQVVGGENGTHFEQIYQRAKVALNNAVAAFDDAKDVTRLMRSEQDSLTDFRTGLEKQELAYTNQLIEIYGLPYPEDVGPGKLYSQGYTGPDLFHFAYTDTSELTVSNLNILPGAARTFKIDTQGYTSDYNNGNKTRFDFIVRAMNSNPEYRAGTNYISLTFDAQGNFKKPDTFVSKRPTPGKIQDAIGRIILARNNAERAAAEHEALKRKLDRGIEFLDAKLQLDKTQHDFDSEAAIIRTTLESVAQAAKIGKMIYDKYIDGLEEATQTAMEFIPKVQIFGLANGGDILSTARGTIAANYAIQSQVNGPIAIAKEIIVGGLTVAKDGYLRDRDANVIGPATRDLESARYVLDLDTTLGQLQTSIYDINARLDELDAAVRNYQTVVAEGQRLQDERFVFRQRAAAVVQGFRTRDAAFRLFRDEKLERYKTLFDLSARYAYLSATAYDYETGLLNTDTGRKFVNRIVSSRALGVVRNGEPQYAGSNTGDPGLSSALAEMKADWDVLRGRLGFNNPDAYGTTVSLRTENFRILPGDDGLGNWKDLLRANVRGNLLEDADVKRYCMQIAGANNVAVPGIVIEFSTSIQDGYNLFGRLSAAGDHNYSPSSFATKIFGVGVAFEGYRGMDNPVANNSAVTTSGGSSPSDPPSWYLDPLALNATPYIYLVPVGADAMRSPPLGDASVLRTWNVNDVAIPLPFNIGGSDFAADPQYTSSDSLSEPLFAIRKHQAFRPVSTTAAFSPSLYTTTGSLQRSQFMNNRLVGRSVWNTKWKLIIPAKALLSDEKAALDRFVQTVTDIKLHFVTYSYSGN